MEVKEIQQAPELKEALSKQQTVQLPPELVSKQLFKQQTNQELSKLLKWKSVKLLTLLGKTKSTHYSTIYLRKKGKSGKLRVIHNPDSLMRAVQFRILREVLEKVQIPEYVYAFEKGKSIPNMADLHVQKSVIVSLDLQDFFTSIKQHHLLDVFTKLGFGAQPARTLSELCTYKAYVPQGALTSPKMSNIITAFTFGPQLKKYCDEKGLTLTIYADDVTISASEDIIKLRGYDAAREIINHVSQVVSEWGFKVNHRKTKVMRAYQRQYVCGVVVNQRVNLQKSERNKLRAIVYNIGRNGVTQEASKTGDNPASFVSKLMGRLNWFSQLNPEAGARLISKLKQILEGNGQPKVGDGSVKGEHLPLDVTSTVPEQSTTAVETPWN
jgi:RNA-directed DNA polymerase